MDSAISCEPAEHRYSTRTHLFVVATLCWNEGSAPVHVRNMSAKGALIEAAVLPKPASMVVLKRGSLEVRGRIAWAASGQAGLSFSTSVNVADWMTKRTNSQQDRVDEIVASLKADELGFEQPAAALDRPNRLVEIETELALLRADLTRLGDALTSDVILVANHPEIQLIDIALQRVARIMAAPDWIRNLEVRTVFES